MVNPRWAKRGEMWVFESQQMRHAIVSRNGMTRRVVDVDVLGAFTRPYRPGDERPLPPTHYLSKGHGKVAPRPDGKVIACTVFNTKDPKFQCERCHADAEKLRERHKSWLSRASGASMVS